MRPTRKGMADYSTGELIDYVEAMDRKVKKAPAFIRRTSYVTWAANSSAICSEIQRRQFKDMT